MSLIKHGDAEYINVIHSVDVTDEDTKSKLDDLKDDLKDKSAKYDSVAQEQK